MLIRAAVQDTNIAQHGKISIFIMLSYHKAAYKNDIAASQHHILGYDVFKNEISLIKMLLRTAA